MCNEPVADVFASEHAKRARHLAAAGAPVDPDQLLKRLMDSEGYRKTHNPAGRLECQRRLLELYLPPDDASERQRPFEKP